MRISAVIITYNEEQNVERCLTSLVGLVDEIIVLDSNSTDRTRALCMAAGAKVFTEPFAGHIEQKNRAVALAQYDWLLSLDADEELSRDLYSSIEAVKTAEPKAQAYTFNRLNQYCGHWVRYGGWYPDKKLRLWHRDYGAWGGFNPHDRVILKPEAKVQHLAGDLLHYAYRSVEEHRKKTAIYAHISAKAKYAAGKRTVPGFSYVAALWCFIQMYFLRLGLLDGHAGFHIAVISSREKYLKYQYLNSQR